MPMGVIPPGERYRDPTSDGPDRSASLVIAAGRAPAEKDAVKCGRRTNDVDGARAGAIDSSASENDAAPTELGLF